MTMLMNTKKTKESQKNQNQDTIKNLAVWFLASLIAILGFAGYGWVQSAMTAFSSLYMTVVCVAVLAVASMSKEGDLAKQTVVEAYSELRFISWPNQQEVLQLTGIVIFCLVIATILLAILDGIISLIFGYMIG